jgi:hypothetical protein
MKTFVLKHKAKAIIKKKYKPKNPQYNYAFLTNQTRIFGYYMSSRKG